MKDTKQKWFKDAEIWTVYPLGTLQYSGRRVQRDQTDRIAEWIENDLNIPVEEYRKLAEQFNPTGFNADDFVKRAKEQWGMKYIVLTANAS